VLFEEEVVYAVARFLVGLGWAEVSRVATRSHGDDLVMARGTRHLFIEAKGATSSDPRTARFGLEFNAAQVADHVSKAVLRALRWVSAGGADAAVALPDNRRHRLEIGRVQPAIRGAGIGVFWVSEKDAAVEADCPFSV
jgi:hypothetical protein